MKRSLNIQLLQPSLENSYSGQVEASLAKNGCSTKHSHSIKSKFLHHHDTESVSHTSTMKGVSTSYNRKQQNKQSAKKCRLRKKERYYELQTKQEFLLKEKQKLQEEKADLKEKLEKYVSSSNIPNIFNIIGRTEAYQRLSKIIEVEDVIDQDEINLILDHLKNRVGAAGTERQGKITYIFKQIVHISFPALHRFLMWTASNDTHYFGIKQMDNNWMNTLDQIVNLTQEQRQFIKSTRNEFKQHYQIFSQLISEMKVTKRKMEEESAILQEQIQQLRRILTPTQCAKLITFIESNKYKEEMDLWIKRNIRKFSEESSPPAADPGCTKQLKTEEDL